MAWLHSMLSLNSPSRPYVRRKFMVAAASQSYWCLVGSWVCHAGCRVRWRRWQSAARGGEPPLLGRVQAGGVTEAERHAEALLGWLLRRLALDATPRQARSQSCRHRYLQQGCLIVTARRSRTQVHCCIPEPGVRACGLGSSSSVPLKPIFFL